MKEPKLTQDGISYTVFSQGDSDWHGDVAAPLAEAIEEKIPHHVGDFPPALWQRADRGAVNAWLAPVIIGLTLFVSKKVSDDFWDVIVKPRVRKCFEWLDRKLTGGNRKARKIFNSSIWYKEHNVIVTISVLGKDFSEIVSQLDLLSTVHSNALNWIAQHGVAAPVHHYRIENRKVNAAPLLAERVDCLPVAIERDEERDASTT